MGRKTSTALLTSHPLKDLGVKDEDAGKVLFLSVNPLHTGHDVDTGEMMSECRICRLWGKFRETIQKQSLQPLKRELKVRTLKLCQHDIDTLGESTLESNFSDIDDELSVVDEELLTFTEVLNMLQYPLPPLLKDKLQLLLATKKIPVRQNAKISQNDKEPKKNNFLSYTNNKKLSEICDTLSAEEVYALKEFVLRQKEDDIAVIKMTEALSEINDPEALENIVGMKDVVFYYIILTMFKESLLDRLYTHVLEHFLKGAHDSLPDADQRTHIPRAIEQLKRYPLTSNPPGICIIFNMTNTRDGAEADVMEVRKVFEKDFNYDVFVKLNPKVKDVKTLITKLNSPRNMFYDSLVVFFMAHGDKSYLHVKDGQIHRRADLMQPFADIEWLKRKPKLFFFQACANRRASRSSFMEGTAGMRTSTDSLSLGLDATQDWKRKYGQHTNYGVVNSLADTLVSYATMWYQPASRNEEGSLYINTLLDCMKHNGKETSIENVLRDMHYKVNTVSLLNLDDCIWKQTPYYESSLQKQFILPS